MNYGQMVKVIVSAPYPAVSWTSPSVFQPPYLFLCPYPCPFPCLCLYLCLCPCLGLSLCIPFLSPCRVPFLFLLPCCDLPLFLVPCRDHAAPCLSPCRPSLCCIFPPQTLRQARNSRGQTMCYSYIYTAAIRIET